MMLREANLLCNLSHQNVLHIFGVVPEKGWIIMELCTGGALSELLRNLENELDEHTLLRFAAETATGVAYLHCTNLHGINKPEVIHGDLKAANVLLMADHSVRIADFGLAEVKDLSKTSNNTAPLRGFTSKWTAPEVLNGKKKSVASDVFALGMTMYEIFERELPFGDMVDSVVERIIREGIRPSVGFTVPPLVAKLMDSCWAEDVTARPSADVVAYTLTHLLGPDTADEAQAAADTEAAALADMKASTWEVATTWEVDADVEAAKVAEAAATPLATMKTSEVADGENPIVTHAGGNAAMAPGRDAASHEAGGASEARGQRLLELAQAAPA